MSSVDRGNRFKVSQLENLELNRWMNSINRNFECPLFLSMDRGADDRQSLRLADHLH